MQAKRHMTKINKIIFQVPLAENFKKQWNKIVLQ